MTTHLKLFWFLASFALISFGIAYHYFLQGRMVRSSTLIVCGVFMLTWLPYLWKRRNIR